MQIVYIRNPHFTVEKIEVFGDFTDEWHHRFSAYSAIEGSGVVMTGDIKCFTVALGDSFVRPAAAGPVKLIGDFTVLKAMHFYVGNESTLHQCCGSHGAQPCTY